MKTEKSNHLRNLIFGAEDSLVSTLGVLFGIASTAQFSKTQIFITGIITVCVEALSMGAGSFLSESSTQEVEKKVKYSPLADGIIMFVAYLIFGFIPVTPYLLFEISTAMYVSVVVTLIALFFLGYAPAKRAKSGLKMAVIAGCAAIMGFCVAYFFKI